MKESPIVHATNIHKSYKDVKALKGVDLDILPGEFTALLGPNGAGKTTLVEIIEGIQKPDKGEILLFGKTWKGNEDFLHRLIGLSLQETRFEDKLTVKETLKVFASFYGLSSQRVEEIIDLVDLREKQKSYVVNLSGGQRQKLAMGIALLNKPRLLILDEPTTGLDPNARREIWAVLGQLKKVQGTSMILTTHYMEEAQTLCEQIVILDHGNILARGSFEELTAKNGTSEIIQFTLQGECRPPDLGRFSNEIRKIDWDESSRQMILHVVSAPQLLPDLVSFLNETGCKTLDLRCRYITLDDLFTQMTGRKLTD